MNKEKLRKLIGIIGTVIGIAGFALCVISIFVAINSSKSFPVGELSFFKSLYILFAVITASLV